MIKKILKLLGKRWLYRDAGTGRFVSKAYAEAHKETTVREKAE